MNKLLDVLEEQVKTDENQYNKYHPRNTANHTSLQAAVSRQLVKRGVYDKPFVKKVVKKEPVKPKQKVATKKKIAKKPTKKKSFFGKKKE
jgi:hypothetical protein